MATAVRQTSRAAGFRSLDEEVHVDSVPVTGTVPAWLHGTLVRVTPALMDGGGKTIKHWFDGAAMLNAFGFGDGGVSYGSRFLADRLSRRRAPRRGRLRLRRRPVPLALQARHVDERRQQVRQRQREPPGARPPLHRDDRDAAAGRVRPEDARDARQAGLARQGRLRAGHDRASALRLRARRDGQLHRPLRPEDAPTASTRRRRSARSGG